MPSAANPDSIESVISPSTADHSASAAAAGEIGGNAGADGTHPIPPALLASMDQPSAGPAGDPGRPALMDPERDPLLLELPKVLADEATRLQQHGSNSMSVALRVEERMELFVHFTQAPGGVEVQVRCDPHDQARIKAIWPRLAGALAPRLRLAPLRDTNDPETASFAASASVVTRSHPERRRRFRRPGWETWA